MAEWKRWAPIVIALVVSLGITAVLGTGMLSGDGGSERVDVDRDQNRTPAPVSNTTPTGESPTAVTDFAGFENVAPTVGFDYDSTFRGRGLMTQSGVYVVDYNNDGYEDILATGGERPALFENTGGAFERARVFDDAETRVAHFLDYDNDGWQDLVLAEYAGGFVFYENDNGTFTQRDVGLDNSVQSPTSITSADFTGNGCLDLFVGVNGLWQQGQALPSQERREVFDKHPEVRPTTTPGGENLLFYGDCETFGDATEQANIRGQNWTLAVSAADFTGDGNVDIHIGNDFSADFLYVNAGNGTFERHDLGPKTDRNAMASVARDMTGDGRLDLFVTNIYANRSAGMGDESEIVQYGSAVPEGNNLLVNTGESGEDLFVDRAPEHGLDAGGWGWAASVADYTNDGHLDVIHGTVGNTRLDRLNRFQTPQVWRGTPDSWEAVDEPKLGLKEHHARGLARLDYDNDGALDFAVATTSFTIGGGDSATPFALYENQLQSNESVQLLLRNADGIARNAVVVVETNNRTVQRTVGARADFLSQNSRLVHIGTAGEAVREVRVLWPDGTESAYADAIESGHRYIVRPDGVERVE